MFLGQHRGEEEGKKQLIEAAWLADIVRQCVTPAILVQRLLRLKT